VAIWWQRSCGEQLIHDQRAVPREGGVFGQVTDGCDGGDRNVDLV